MKNLLLILLFPLAGVAQVKTPLIAEGSAGALYISHTAGPKENMYSIGRIYNISPRIIAPFNNVALEDGIKIGQVIKVPLTEINYSKEGNALAGEVLVPVHTRSGNRNTVIGYLKVNPELSSLASLAVKPAAKPVSEPKKESPVVVKEEPKPVVQKEEVKQPVKQPEPVATKGDGFNGGAFRSLFRDSGKQESGTAGMFKSTSGWEDGKYYCLHNKAQAGTIIKVTNRANGRSVYAKVLDVIPDIKQNEGMALRISNAAASELGAGIENFDCTINY